MNVKLKVLLIAGASAVLVGLAGIGGIAWTTHGAAELRVQIELADANQLATARLLADFKTQVQEWKDVLLRGSEPASMARHWGGFERQEALVDQEGRALAARLGDSPARNLVQEFLAAHATMGVNYRKGLDAFRAADFAPQVGDTAVIGMDRVPAGLLTKAIAAIDLVKAETGERSREAAQRALMGSLACILLGLAAGTMVALPLARSITRQLGGEPGQAAAIAREIACGNLTVSIEPQGAPESMMAAMRDMRDGLADLVNQIRRGVDAVGTASSEIASGTADLSARTERQAASLEQTTASMDRITGNVQQNADSARQASQIAGAASQAAEQGGTLVNRVVETMDHIAASSRKMADIIGVIDGIAFQTNILALNAAVEAARAGDQGRGFAVVAAEVRVLAQRSAQSAREIKAIISASADQVEGGARVAADAGAAMKDIVARVQRVTALIADITNATTSESTEIREVCCAVALMDQGTQQNAALVEQSAAAAHSLNDQVALLTAAIRSFRT